MAFYQYLFMCLYIGIYLYFNTTGASMPEFLHLVNLGVSAGFLLWAGYQSGKIIVDCILSSFKNEMTAPNVRNGILMALLHFLPTLLMSVFMLKEGFVSN